MELKSTSIGKRLAQHPYNRVRLLHAGVEVSGDKHQYLIPFNQILAIQCRRGIVWGELEFELPEEKVVRLHGTEWQETQRFYRYLQQLWQTWSEEMSAIAAGVLNGQLAKIQQIIDKDSWLLQQDLARLQAGIQQAIDALPLPVARLEEFDDCREPWRQCREWLEEGSHRVAARNQQWTARMLQEHGDFFRSVESSPLNLAQSRAVVNGERPLLVLAGAGSGKTSLLVARAGWLLRRNLATPDQILLLVFGRQAAREMDDRLRQRLDVHTIQASTFHALALMIIRQGNKKVPVVSQLESDGTARRKLLIDHWRQQCREKKAQAKGWRQWIGQELGWEVPDGDFWQNDKLANRLAGRLELWVGLMRSHGGSQAEMIDAAPDELRQEFQKRIRLLAPLLKAWKQSLKGEGAVDFDGLIHQAVDILQKGRFVSPWKHILVDEFQDISPQRARLITALCQQNSVTALFAVGDDWQAIYRFSGVGLTLTTAFSTRFGGGEPLALDTTYRFNQRIGEVANRFVQQNPFQLAKPLKSLTRGGKKAVLILPEDQFDALLNKLSGFVTPTQRIMVLARYHHLRPAQLAKAATRWPNLMIDFMTIHASKGQQAEYVIIVGVNDGRDGFPAPARELIIEQVLLPQPEYYPDAEERRLLYVALTRAKEQVWLLTDKAHPSVFIEELLSLGVPRAKKP